MEEARRFIWLALRGRPKQNFNMFKVNQCIGLHFCVSFPSSCHSREERSEASIQTQEETRSNTYFYCPSSAIILCGSSHLITNLNK
uniref:Uncharacterized protein n=1 Tax=Triticum urartu TaxID=4572 RepID=A0A8R7QLC0_TRIUA